MKRKLLVLLLVTLTLASMLGGCSNLTADDVDTSGFVIDDNYSTTGLIIYAGDTREFASTNSGHTYEIDHVNTLYDIGDIRIEGTKFIVPEDTLDIIVSVNVLYKGKQIDLNSRTDVEVINNSEAATDARGIYSTVLSENEDLYFDVTDYEYAMSNGAMEIAEYEETIAMHEEAIKNSSDPEDIERRETSIKFNKASIVEWQEKIIIAKEQYDTVKPKFDANIAELDELLTLFHQPIKGGLKL